MVSILWDMCISSSGSSVVDQRAIIEFYCWSYMLVVLQVAASRSINIFRY